MTASKIPHDPREPWQLNGEEVHPAGVFFSCDKVEVREGMVARLRRRIVSLVPSCRKLKAVLLPGNWDGLDWKRIRVTLEEVVLGDSEAAEQRRVLELHACGSSDCSCRRLYTADNTAHVVLCDGCTLQRKQWVRNHKKQRLELWLHVDCRNRIPPHGNRRFASSCPLYRQWADEWEEQKYE